MKSTSYPYPSNRPLVYVCVHLGRHIGIEIEKEIEIKIDIEMDRVIGTATVPRWGGALCAKMFGVRRQKKSGPCKAQET